MGQGVAMLCQLRQAGKSDCGNAVPLENRQGVSREGARKRIDSLFPLAIKGPSFTPKPLQRSHALCPCPCHSKPLSIP